MSPFETHEENGSERTKAKRRNKPMRKSNSDPRIKSGRWTDSERRIFLKGLKQFGRGKWKEIATLIPTRSTVQVKTHAQMVMKRVHAGEDVFAEFQDSPVSNNGQQGDSSISISISAAHGYPMKPNNMVPLLTRPTTETLKIYDGLSQQDQGAVLILTQLRALRVL